MPSLKLACLAIAAVFVAGCVEKPDRMLPDDELSIFLDLSHDKTFEQACAEIQALCESSGSGCFAFEFFCNPETKDEWVCLRLHYACRDGKKQSACDRYDQRCTDVGATIPEADAGVPTPEPDVGVPTPEPDVGVPTPDPDVGVPSGIITSPICVWNQAYEEAGNNDSVSAILAGAKGCYVLIDPFDSSSARNAIGQMKQSNNIVGCYISVGSCEDWRDDYNATKPYCGPSYPGWPGEYFVTDPVGILPLMKARIDKMASWGCDMVEFDNMDWAYDGGNGTGVSTSEAHAYIKALCDHTHAKGMKCMAKSTTEGASNFDGMTVESYSNDKNWWSSSELKAILDAGKLGLIVHYEESDCDGVYSDYQTRYGYGDKLSFICSDNRAYKHYNQ